MPVKDNNPKVRNAVTATTTPRSAIDVERDDLLAALATARSALTNTIRGLSDEQLGERPTVSAQCLGGLIKHVASMEEAWMRFVVEGPSAMRYDLPDGVTWADFAAGTAREIPQWMIDHQNDFRMLPGETLAGVVERYEQVAARSEEILAAVPDLSATHPLPEPPWHEPGAVNGVTVKTRELGRTGIRVSPYRLGTMMFGTGHHPDYDCLRIIRRALDAGIDFVDIGVLDVPSTLSDRTRVALHRRSAGERAAAA